jgi:predicted regulator of Ras-like GTPase activity (Roadblock/LC7/MglB family)
MPSALSQPAPLPTPATVLDDLVDQFHDATGAILASVDGFSIAQSSSMSDEASHPAMLAAAVGLAHQIVSMSGGEELRQLVVEHDRGLLLAWPIGSQRVLAVLAQHSIDQRRLHSFVHARTQVLIGAGS